jgi:hypothetical protein
VRLGGRIRGRIHARVRMGLVRMVQCEAQGRMSPALRAREGKTMGKKGCKRCGAPVDPVAIRRELRERTGDIPETCGLAAEESAFCGLTCALNAFVDRNDAP